MNIQQPIKRIHRVAELKAAANLGTSHLLALLCPEVDTSEMGIVAKFVRSCTELLHQIELRDNLMEEYAKQNGIQQDYEELSWEQININPQFIVP